MKSEIGREIEIVDVICCVQSLGRRVEVSFPKREEKEPDKFEKIHLFGGGERNTLRRG